MIKHCSKCNKKYPRTKKYFVPDKRRKDGLGSWCKGCANADGLARYRKNKEKYHKCQVKYCQTLRGYVSRLMGCINTRCTNKKSQRYEHYGGRGICCLFTGNELYNWLVSKNINPRGLDIHRIDNDSNYTLDNIGFLTRSEHMRLHHSQRKNSELWV